MIRSRQGRAVFAALVVAATVLASGLAAQERGWRVTAAAGQTWFSGGLLDTTSTDIDYTLAPTVTWAMSADHPLGRVRLGVGLSYLSTSIQASGPALMIVDPTVDVRQWAISALVTVPLLHIGKGGAGFSLAAGPALGFWSITGSADRTTIGGIAAVEFTAPITADWGLLASGGGSLSGSPFEASDLPVEFEPSTLWSGQVGLGVRYAF
jgi:hypothetical protein